MLIIFLHQYHHHHYPHHGLQEQSEGERLNLFCVDRQYYVAGTNAHARNKEEQINAEAYTTTIEDTLSVVTYESRREDLPSLDFHCLREI